MKRIVFAFALGMALTGWSSAPALAETCSQAKGKCEANCNRGWSRDASNQKNACLPDCGNRFNECLQSGSWRSNRPSIPQRDGLIKR